VLHSNKTKDHPEKEKKRLLKIANREEKKPDIQKALWQFWGFIIRREYLEGVKKGFRDVCGEASVWRGESKT